jgi:hypothetical protein
MGEAMNRFKAEATPVLPKRSTDPKDDIKTLHLLMPGLDDDGLLAVYLRFWDCRTIQEISMVLGRSWDETDRIIEQSIQHLREEFIARDVNTSMATAA